MRNRPFESRHLNIPVEIMRRNKIAICLIFIYCMSSGSPPVVGAFAEQDSNQAQQTGAAFKLAGLRQGVTVRRDDRGIPRIEAANEPDLFFMQGYVTASDRLWQMDLLRRTARGELSEIFGKSTLEEDKRQRVYGFAALAESQVNRLPSNQRSVYEEYARGVNAFIESLDAKSLPVEFQLLKYSPRLWMPADSLIVGKLLAESLSNTWMVDLVNALFADLPPTVRQELRVQTSAWDVLVVGNDKIGKDEAGPVTHRASVNRSAVKTNFLAVLSSVEEVTRDSLKRVGIYAPELAASNNWVVSGKRSLSGKPLLANDPHLEPSAPSIWYMTHLEAPTFNVAGATLPGVPCILLGHNDQIAWGATNLGSDVQDVYIEKFDKQNPKLYATPQGWREASIRREEIKVRKGFNDFTSEIIPFEITLTRHGPIALEMESKRYAVRWTVLDPQSLDLPAFYEVNRARSWKQFCSALSAYSGPAQNFVYADKEGHIGYYGAGKVPIRRTGDGTLPYDGSTDNGEWVGFVSFDKLPHVYDPPSGMIVTANNRIVGEDYPYLLTQNWLPPYRARRIFDLLQSKAKLTIEDFRKIQRDTYSISGAHFARKIVEIAGRLDPDSKDDKWNETINALKGWDGRLDAESRAGPLLLYMRVAFRVRVAGRVMGGERANKYVSWVSSNFLDRVIGDQPKQWLPEGFNNYLELLKACEKEARKELTARLGADDSQWIWGRVAEVRFAHPLSSAPLIGQRFAIAALQENGSRSAFPTVNAGGLVSMRFITDLSDWDKTEMGITLGESGDPSSPHWKDQLADWRAAKAGAFPFTRQGVAGTTMKTFLFDAARK